MPWMMRAGLAALMLNCAATGTSAAEPAHWLTDTASGCALFDATARDGDSVNWSGACSDGKTSGPGTASFRKDGNEFESFTGIFSAGVATDGPAVLHWGDGWSYDGAFAGGHFNGKGVLTNDKRDRFDGIWADGKMNGPGVIARADGERYEGELRDDRPNGKGVLTRADGTRIEGVFADGKLENAPAANQAEVPQSTSQDKQAATDPAADKPVPDGRAFAALSGKTLVGVDGSGIALTLIEGGIERQITPVGAAPEKATFTYMNERLGTVVEDGGPAAGANVTGFFRLTDTGVEVRYADGRSELLSTSDDGGVEMRLEAPGKAPSCRSWYPQGHVFSDAQKKAALADYAGRLGLAMAATDTGSCVSQTAAAPAPLHPASVPAPRPKPHARPISLISRLSAATPQSAAALTPALSPAALEPVTVKDFGVHTVDADVPAFPGTMTASEAPTLASSAAAPASQDASHCLKVESDGHDWGFHNACAFSVQFAYCVKQASDGLASCGNGGVSGSVAANGFGALSADKSFSETDADHDFRWVACAGGAGEVAAHLDHSDPPSGHCARSVTASNTP